MLLSLLGFGRTTAELYHIAELRGASPEAVDEVLRRLRSAGLLARADEQAPRIHVHGAGPIASALTADLIGGGAQVSTTCAAPLRKGLAEHRAELVVLTDQIVPDPAVVHQLMAAAIPHLRVRLLDGDGQIGPLVLPGRTGCLWCEQQHAAAADPHWPDVLRQIGSATGQASPRVLRDVLAQASAEVRHALRFLRSRHPVPSPRTLGAVVEHRWDGVLSSPRRRPAHPRCLFHAVLPHRAFPPITGGRGTAQPSEASRRGCPGPRRASWRPSRPASPPVQDAPPQEERA